MIRGSFSIEKAVYVDNDQLLSFEKTIQLMNGDNLKVSPLELTYRVQIIEELPNGKHLVKYKLLPTSLFSQALVNDKICYTKGTKNYELQWTPFSYVENAPVNNFSINSNAKCAIPNSYKVMKRNHTFYALSPEAKRIHLNQNGTTPLDFDDLKLLHCDKTRRIKTLFRNEDETGLTLALDACGEPYIEILLDQNQIYATLLTPDNHLKGTAIPISFFHTVIDSEENLINESRIAAWIEEDRGVLWIKIPFSAEPDPKRGFLPQI